MDFAGEIGWNIYNGNIKEDEEEEFTFIGGRENTVIDYILRDEEAKKWIDRMRVGNEADSDH